MVVKNRMRMPITNIYTIGQNLKLSSGFVHCAIPNLNPGRDTCARLVEFWKEKLMNTTKSIQHGKITGRRVLGLGGALLALVLGSASVYADHDRHDRCDVERHVHHHYYQNGHNYHRGHHYNRPHKRRHQVHNHYYGGGYGPGYSHGGGYYHQPSYHAGYSRRPGLNLGNAVGGAVGGYLGSQIGSGSGNQAATAAGAILGYALGGRF